LSVVSQNISLKLEGVGGVTIKNLVSRIKGADNKSGTSVELNLGDIYSEEERDIMALVLLPPTDTPHDDFLPAINITMSYFNVLTSSVDTTVATAYIKRPLNACSDQPINMYIDKQRNRLTAAAAMDLATKINKSDTAARVQARNILEVALDTMKKSASAEDKFTQTLMSDVRSCLLELADLSADYSSVQKKMSQKSLSHSRQRGHYDSGMYDNSSKTSLKHSATFSIGSSSNLNSSNNNNNTNNSSNNQIKYNTESNFKFPPVQYR